MDWGSDPHDIVREIARGMIYWFTGSLVHSVSCVWILLCHFIGTSSTICSFVDAPRNFNTSVLLHPKNFPIGHSCVKHVIDTNANLEMIVATVSRNWAQDEIS